MEIAFASPAFNYKSYSDLHEVFGKCGVKHVKFPNMDPYAKDTVYICTPANGELEHIRNYKDRTCKVVWWFLERVQNVNEFKGFKREQDAGFWDGVLVSDMGYYDELKKRGVNVAFCPIGVHETFGTPDFSAKKRWDIVHISYRDIWRRSQLFGKIPKGISIAPNGWGEKRRQSLHHSKFLLNTHQDETQVIEPLRLILAVCHGVPIITETITRPRPYHDSGRMLMVEYKRIPRYVSDRVRDYTRNPTPFVDSAKRNYEFFSSHFPFFSSVEHAINELRLL